jgi:hypothetical protein
MTGRRTLSGLRRFSALAVLVCVIAWLGSLEAHEIGTTRVAVSFAQPGRYDIEIVTDAAALAEKLETVAGSAGASAVSTPAVPSDATLTALDAVFRQRVRIEFDGTAAHPAISYAIARPADALSPPVATIHLSGEMPRGARQVTWTYAWTFASYALTVRSAGATVSTQWLEGGQTSAPLSLTTPPAPPGGLGTAWRYLTLGFTHIVPYGFDHVLFVLGLFLLSGRLRTVLWQVSAFTCAHSITLGLSIYGLIAVPPSIVEPLIAVSIAYVAIENLFLNELKPWRVGLVFAFGLLHGMGFAGALKDLGLPPSEFLTALVTFNIGVEAGQMAVIAAAFLLVGSHCSHRDWYRRRIVVPASVIIACTAAYWTVTRLAL